MNMTDYFVKDPIDCSDAELNKFLITKGVEDAKTLKRSDKVKIAQLILKSYNRNTIIFKAPKSGVIGRSIFRAKRWLSRNEHGVEVPEVDDLVRINSTPSAPSVVSSVNWRVILQDQNTEGQNTQGQSTRVYNNVPQERTLPAFDPSSISRASSETASNVANYAVSYPGSEASFEAEEVKQVPKRPAPRLAPRPAPRPAPRRLAPLPRKIVDLSHLEEARINDVEFEPERLSNKEASKQEISTNEVKGNINSLLTNDQTAVTRNFNRYKFTLKFDTNTVSIEDYLKSLNRWRLANNASDENAINQGLQNFKNVSLANNIVETLSGEAQCDFAVFYGELMDKLGKSRREWYRVFQTDTRNKNESAVEYFGKLCAHLKLGLGKNDLSEAEENQITEKFLESVHPDLRGFLVIREPEVSFCDVATVAQKIESARNIPRVKPATVNNIMPGKPKSAPKTSNGPKRESRFFCHVCNRGGHSTDFCYGNPTGKYFNLEKFRQSNNVQAKNTPALN